MLGVRGEFRFDPHAMAEDSETDLSIEVQLDAELRSVEEPQLVPLWRRGAAAQPEGRPRRPRLALSAQRRCRGSHGRAAPAIRLIDAATTGGDAKVSAVPARPSAHPSVRRSATPAGLPVGSGQRPRELRVSARGEAWVWWQGGAWQWARVCHACVPLDTCACPRTCV